MDALCATQDRVPVNTTHAAKDISIHLNRFFTITFIWAVRLLAAVPLKNYSRKERMDFLFIHGVKSFI